MKRPRALYFPNYQNFANVNSAPLESGDHVAWVIRQLAPIKSFHDNIPFL